MKNKIITIVSVLVLGVTAAWAQGGNEFTIPLSDPAKRGTLKAHLNYGSITVKGTARKDVLVGYKQEKDDDDDDRNKKSGSTTDGLKRIGGGGMEIEASENNNMVKVGSDSWNTKTNLIIEIPSNMDLKVSTYNDGDIMITNIQGEVELTNYNGEITALNISGSVVATTYNGEIKVTFDKVTDGTPMSYSTYNGDIDITFPASLKATFKMKTDQGEIFTGFDMAVGSSGPVQKKDGKSGGFKLVIDEWKKGDVNGGGAEITMRNYNGDIKIRKK
jgi:hypothetical protein